MRHGLKNEPVSRRHTSSPCQVCRLCPLPFLPPMVSTFGGSTPERPSHKTNLSGPQALTPWRILRRFKRPGIYIGAIGAPLYFRAGRALRRRYPWSVPTSAAPAVVYQRRDKFCRSDMFFTDKIKKPVETGFYR